MGTKKNVERLEKAYERWHETRGGSAEEWMGLMADEVRFRSLAQGTPRMEFTQERRSRQEVGDYFAGLAADWTMHHYTTDRFIVDGRWVVVMGRCKFESRATGRVVETPKVDVFKFRRGKIVRFYEFFDTAAALRALEPDPAVSDPAEGDSQSAVEHYEKALAIDAGHETALEALQRLSGEQPR